METFKKQPLTLWNVNEVQAITEANERFAWGRFPPGDEHGHEYELYGGYTPYDTPREGKEWQPSPACSKSSPRKVRGPTKGSDLLELFVQMRGGGTAYLYISPTCQHLDYTAHSLHRHACRHHRKEVELAERCELFDCPRIRNGTKCGARGFKDKDELHNHYRHAHLEGRLAGSAEADHSVVTAWTMDEKLASSNFDSSDGKGDGADAKDLSW